MNSTDFVSVAPIKPPAPWVGGKHHLAKRITAIIDRIDHTCYAEPFLGMGGVFFKRSRRPRVEVINDKHQDVANLFRILQRHYVPFVEMMRFQLCTRAEFERLKAINPDTLTDLERAARFLYLQKTVFGGRVTSQSFGIAATLPARFDMTKLVPILEDLHSRLVGVLIECLDYVELVKRYDKPETFYYIDPPYFGSEDIYGGDLFDRGGFVSLKDLLSGIQGRFIMSLNNQSEIRELYADTFNIAEVDTRYTCTKGSNPKVSELLISNFDLGIAKAD